MRVTRNLLFCLLLLTSPALGAPEPYARRATSPPSGEDDFIALRPGEQRVESAVGVQSYSEGTRGVVEVRLTKDGEQFVLVGLRPGKTTVLLLMKNGEQRTLTIEVRESESASGSVLEEGEVVPKRDNIRLDFYFVELDRSYQHRIGVDPVDSVGGPVVSAGFDFLAQSFQSATAVVAEQALFRLDWAQSVGMAKLSRRASVITENFQKSRLEGGGEVNIPLTGSLSTGIHKIEFGSVIEVEPRYDSRSGRLELALGAEVSDLTDDRGSGAPGRITSSIRTMVNLELGQAVILAGLSSTSETKTKSGIPWLSQIPLFGVLFGSDAATKHASEQVVFIVPTVSRTTSAESKRAIEAAFEAYREFDGNRSVQDKLRRTYATDGAE